VAQKALTYVKGLRGAGARQAILLRVISDKSMECIQKGISLAGREVSDCLSQAFQSLQDEALQQIRPVEDELIEVTARIESGVPKTKIVEIAEEENVSTIVLVSHGRSNVSAVLLGSVSDHVIRHAKCPVIIVKRS